MRPEGGARGSRADSRATSGARRVSGRSGGFARCSLHPRLISGKPSGLRNASPYCTSLNRFQFFGNLKPSKQWAVLRSRSSKQHFFTDSFIEWAQLSRHHVDSDLIPSMEITISFRKARSVTPTMAHTASLSQRAPTVWALFQVASRATKSVAIGLSMERATFQATKSVRAAAATMERAQRQPILSTEMVM